MLNDKKSFLPEQPRRDDRRGELRDPLPGIGRIGEDKVVGAVRAADEREGVVLEVVQKGFTLGDRVLRPARVVISGGAS